MTGRDIFGAVICSTRNDARLIPVELSWISKCLRGSRRIPGFAILPHGSHTENTPRAWSLQGLSVSQGCHTLGGCSSGRSRNISLSVREVGVVWEELLDLGYLRVISISFAFISWFYPFKNHCKKQKGCWWCFQAVVALCPVPPWLPQTRPSSLALLA